jgi:hypothetical protein
LKSAALEGRFTELGGGRRSDGRGQSALGMAHSVTGKKRSKIKAESRGQRIEGGRRERKKLRR